MEQEQLFDGIRQALTDGIGEAMKVVVQAVVNRGVCAGSVTYSARADKKSVTEVEIMARVRAAYEANGLGIDLSTDEGARTFLCVLLEACKIEVGANHEVYLVDRLAFKPTAYADGSGSYMQPVGPSREFNRLPSEIELDKSPALLKRAQRRAKRKPFDSEAAKGNAPVAPQSTMTRCPNCGHEFAIAQSETWGAK